MNNHEPNTPETNLAELEYAHGEPQGGETADFREHPAHQVSPIDRLPETVSISEMAKRCGAPAPKGEI